MKKRKKNPSFIEVLSKKGKRFWIVLTAIVLAAVLLCVGLVSALTASAAVYRFGGATLREDAYGYWFASYKYAYLVQYKELGATDSASGWEKTDESGRTYEDIFYEMIDEEIRIRFLAATVFDSAGYRLSDARYKELSTLIDELNEERFGERGFTVLKEDYGVSKRAVKQVALYEQKYRALYENMFADGSVIYADEYRQALKTFYEKYYLRYNMIYVKNDKASALEAALADGVTEEEFTALEAVYNPADHKITSGNYPNGIYLYAGGNYTGVFTEELIAAFGEANAVGKWVKKADASGAGYYFVMRYALDEEPYRSSDEKIKNCFTDLPTYAASYLYRTYLSDLLGELTSLGIAEGYTVAGTKACADYNVIRLLGNA